MLPALDAFRPELLLISAGFDAHKNDPLAQLLLDEVDYTWVTEKLFEIAYRHAGGRLVATLEGGYDLDGAGRQRRGACPRADVGVNERSTRPDCCRSATTHGLRSRYGLRCGKFLAYFVKKKADGRSQQFLRTSPR